MDHKCGPFLLLLSAYMYNICSMENEVLEIVNEVFKGQGKVLSPLVGGMMNKSFIVEYFNEKYVLYISTEQANEMVDRQLEKDNQKLIIDLGLTSKNIYFDTDKGIKVNEYIEGQSLDKAESYDSKEVAKLLKTMHESDKMSRDNYQPFKRFIAYENEAKEFGDNFEANYPVLRKEIFDNREFLESQKLVLCHNDAQKSNIVKSTENKYFLIDFEFMGNNDPIYDIATFGNGKVSEGYELLVDYFDGKPTTEEKKRYYLWRIFVSLQWHNVAIVKHFRGEGKVHGFDFLKVADFFFANAMDAYKGLKELN